MGHRVSRKAVEMMFERFAEKCGRKTGAYSKDESGKFHANVGNWFLDHNGTYGGYVIQEIVSDGGGQSAPFGDTRRSAREMLDTMYFALQAVSLAGK